MFRRFDADSALRTERYQALPHWRRTDAKARSNASIALVVDQINYDMMESSIYNSIHYEKNTCRNITNHNRHSVKQYPKAENSNMIKASKMMDPSERQGKILTPQVLSLVFAIT